MCCIAITAAFGDLDLWVRPVDLRPLLDQVLHERRVAVTVVDADLVVSPWNDPAQQMWGLRSDEVVGKEFLGLDIGLRVQRLLPPLKQALSGPYDEHSEVVGVILVMDEIGAASGGADQGSELSRTVSLP